MTYYQFSLNWLVGIEGDVWTKLTNDNQLDILGDPNNFKLQLDFNNSRNGYVRLSNLPPIKYIVDIIYQSSIMMSTRDNNLLIFSPEYPNGLIFDEIIDSFALQHGSIGGMVYLSANRDLKFFEYRMEDRSELTTDSFKWSQVVRTDIKSIHPMRLSPMSPTEGILDSVFVIHNDGTNEVFSLINERLIDIKKSEGPEEVTKVHLNCVIRPNSILHMILMNRGMNSQKFLQSNEGFNGGQFKDITIINSGSMTDQLVALSNNQILLGDKVMVNYVDKFIELLKGERKGLYITGIDQKTYHAMLGNPRTGNLSIKDLEIPLVL